MKDPRMEALSKSVIAHALAMCAENKTQEEIQKALQEKGLPKHISIQVAKNAYDVYVEGLMKFKPANC